MWALISVEFHTFYSISTFEFAKLLKHNEKHVSHEVVSGTSTLEIPKSFDTSLEHKPVEIVIVVEDLPGGQRLCSRVLLGWTRLLTAGS